jgi:hypothetical protein
MTRIAPVRPAAGGRAQAARELIHFDSKQRYANELPSLADRVSRVLPSGPSCAVVSEVGANRTYAGYDPTHG